MYLFSSLMRRAPRSATSRSHECPFQEIDLRPRLEEIIETDHPFGDRATALAGIVRPMDHVEIVGNVAGGAPGRVPHRCVHRPQERTS